MQSTPKIMVFRLKELLCGAAFIIAGILLLLLLIFAFLPDKNHKDKNKESGGTDTYTASLVLNSIPMEVSVSVKNDKITGAALHSTETSMHALYPLIEPSMSDISDYLVSNQSLADITFDSDNSYTGKVLSNAVGIALEKAGKGQ